MSQGTGPQDGSWGNVFKETRPRTQAPESFVFSVF